MVLMDLREGLRQNHRLSLTPVTRGSVRRNTKTKTIRKMTPDDDIEMRATTTTTATTADTTTPAPVTSTTVGRYVPKKQTATAPVASKGNQQNDQHRSGAVEEEKKSGGKGIQLKDVSLTMQNEDSLDLADNEEDNEDDEERGGNPVMVYIRKAAARNANKSGSRSEYHMSETCEALRGHHKPVLITRDEAMLFMHKKCKFCDED